MTNLRKTIAGVATTLAAIVIAASVNTASAQYATGPLKGNIGGDFGIGKNKKNKGPVYKKGRGTYINPNEWNRLVGEIRALKLRQRRLIVLRNRLYNGYVAYKKCSNQWTRRYIYNGLARKIAYYRSIGRYDIARTYIARARTVGRATRYCKRMLGKRIQQAGTLIWHKRNRLAQLRRQMQG